MNIATTLTTFSAKDGQAAIYAIDRHNAPIIFENTRRAALTPPGTPVALLSKSNASEIKTSYEIIFNAKWISYS